jgi:geranylgeranyl reductase family protein
LGDRGGAAVKSADVDVAVVGGGPAGALTAMLLASRGRAVIVLERAPHWRWRACGVFASPASIAALRSLGFRDTDLELVARPLAAMRVETPGGAAFRLTYGGSGGLLDSAVGFDRSTLDPLLLERARSAGAEVRVGATVEHVVLAGDHARLAIGGDQPEVTARVVVGADGLRSLLARTAGVARSSPLGPRAALSFHLADTEHDRDARMVVIEDGYVGIAPVPGERVNVGIVLGRSWFERLRRDGGRAVADGICSRVLRAAGSPFESFMPLDPVAGVTPLGHAVARRAGTEWLLVGDAAGFLDPFTGEGLHRAIVSAELAATTIDDVLAGRTGSRLADYDRAMRSSFAAKDLVSRIVQAFLARPRLFEYAARRLAARERVRETMGLVIGDIVPAVRALDPRFLAALLAP